MSNETISVPRELMQHIADGGYCHQGLVDQLRALLAHPTERQGKLPPIGRQAMWQAIDEALTGTVEPMLRGDICNILAALLVPAEQHQGEPVAWVELDGLSDQAWRERIGNAVPPAAAEAIAQVMGTTLLLAEAGETFMLSNMPIWVQPVAVALSVSISQP